MADEGMDLNPMQANLGLSGRGSFSPVGYPTPAPPIPPPVLHPGEVSRNIVQQSQTQAVQTIQTANMMRPTPPGYTPGAATPPNAMGAWSAAYANNMASIQGQLIGSPFYAQAMAGLSGGRPFTSSMLPSPMQFTDPSLGLYRPFPQPPAMMVPPVPQLPFIRHPFVPTPPAPRFQTPFEYMYNYQQMNADQWSAAGIHAPSLAARVGVDWGGSWLGAGLGAAAGAMVGGPIGARVGSTVGALGGLLLAERGGFGRAAGHMIDNINPLRSMTLRGAQMQGMSNDWVVGGASLSPLGMGWNRTASVHAGRLIEDLGYNTQFRAETGRQFSVQDLTRITGAAGRAGMLDFAQTPESMRDEVRKIAKQLRVFMQVANEPDVVEAIRQMGQLRSMGLALPETMGVMSNARMFARMAGTTVRGVTETGGLPGALMFQQAGLTAGLGLQVGQGMYGMARQAVAGGAYSVSDIARFGGVQGIAQRNTESALAILQIPLVSAALSSMGSRGGFGVHAGNLQKVLNGEVGINDMARLGVENIHDAVAKNGTGALAMFQLQQPEMQDSIGRALGPIGLKMLQMRSVLDAQKMFGSGKSPGDLAQGALAVFGGDSNQALQFLKESNSQGFFANLRRQLDVQRRENRHLTGDAIERARGGFFDRISRERGALYSMAHGFDQLGTGFRTGLERGGAFFSELGEDLMLRDDESIYRTPSELLASSEKERRVLRNHLGTDRIRHAIGEQHGDPLLEIGGRGYLHGSLRWREGVWGGGSELRRDHRMYQGGLAELVGGGIGETAARFLGLGVGFATGAEVRASVEDHSRAASRLAAAQGQTDSELSTSIENLDKKFGKGGALRVTGRISTILAQIANRKKNIIGHGSALSMADIDAALFEAQRSKQITPNEAKAIKEDIGSGGDAFNLITRQARQRVTAGGDDSFIARASGALGKTDFRNTIENDRAGLLADTWNLFGSNNEKALQTGDVLRANAEDDPNAAIFAALQAASRVGVNGADQRIQEFTEKTMSKLSKDDLEKLMRRSRAILGGVEGLGTTKYLAKTGEHLVAMKAEDMYSAMETPLSRTAQFKSHVTRFQGASELLKDWGTAVRAYGGGSAEETLDTLKGLDSAKQLGGLDPGIRKILNRYIRATTSDERAAAGRDLDEAFFIRGDHGAEARVEGGPVSGNEARLHQQGSNLDELQKQLAQNFPRAVDVFEESARHLDNAAIQLGQFLLRNRPYN